MWGGISLWFYLHFSNSLSKGICIFNMFAIGSNGESHFEKICSRSTMVAVFQWVWGPWRWPLLFQHRYYRKSKTILLNYIIIVLRTYFLNSSNNGCWLFAITFLLQATGVMQVQVQITHDWHSSLPIHLTGKDRYVYKENLKEYDFYSWDVIYTTHIFQQREYFSTHLFSFGHNHYF